MISELATSVWSQKLESVLGQRGRKRGGRIDDGASPVGRQHAVQSEPKRFAQVYSNESDHQLEGTFEAEIDQAGAHAEARPCEPSKGVWNRKGDLTAFRAEENYTLEVPSGQPPPAFISQDVNLQPPHLSHQSASPVGDIG